MSQEFKFTDPGEGLQEAEILEVHVSDGDSVSDGDTVLTVETDKANTDIPAPFTGTVDDVRVAEGDTVQIGDVLMTYSENGDTGGDQEQAESSTDEKSDEDGSDGSEDEKSNEDSSDEKTSGKEAQEEKSGADGKQGRSAQSRQKDNESEQATGQESESGESRESGDESASSKTDSGDRKRQPVPAAPSTRRLAREKDINLHDIEPSGPDGRVTAEDVEAAAEAAQGEKSQSKDQSKAKDKDKTETSSLIPGSAPPELPDFSQWGEIERESLRSIRRATAQNMARSWGQIPHVYHQDIADVTALERFRRNHQPDQGKLTLTVLVMKALTSVLKRFPRFNASLDVANEEIVYKHYCHMGLAVATDRGLLVPVIRDVDRKSVSELAVESADIARKTRNGELSRADMQGGSITVTNPGPLGGSSLTPLINHPQVAILGMGAARLEPVVLGDLDDYTIEPRLRLPLVLGFDHRVNDGADAARFVTTLIETLADPESLLLAV